MDDKTFLANFVASEAERINQRLKKMLADGKAGNEPSDAEKDNIIDDIEATLSRLQSALTQINAENETDDSDEDELELEKLPN